MACRLFSGINLKSNEELVRNGTADAHCPACRGRDGSGCGFGATRQVNYTKKRLEGRLSAPVRRVDDSERASSGFRICPISTQTRNDSREQNPTQGPLRCCQCSPACCELRINFLNPTVRESVAHAENFKLKDVRGSNAAAARVAGILSRSLFVHSSFISIPVATWPDLKFPAALHLARRYTCVPQLHSHKERVLLLQVSHQMHAWALIWLAPMLCAAQTAPRVELDWFGYSG